MNSVCPKLLVLRFILYPDHTWIYFQESHHVNFEGCLTAPWVRSSSLHKIQILLTEANPTSERLPLLLVEVGQIVCSPPLLPGHIPGHLLGSNADMKLEGETTLPESSCLFLDKTTPAHIFMVSGGVMKRDF